MHYDSLDRLIDASGSWGPGSFSYDAIGNRTNINIDTSNKNYSYGSSDNRLSSYPHDANGNVLQDDNFTYEYDSENRLIRATNEVDVITYQYDGDGRRISKTVNGDTTYYAYGIGPNVLTEFNAQGVPKHSYIYAGTKNIARINYDENGAKESTSFYHSDHLGSSLAMTDETTTVVWNQTYLPFGETYKGTSSVNNSHQYTGKEFNEETGLYYYGARYYHPGLGRFMSVDPAPGVITDPQSWNRYAYVQNSPFKYVDPDGEFLETAWDVFNITLGVISLKQNLTQGRYVDALIDAGGIVADGAAAVFPIVPAGVGTAIKVSRQSAKVVNSFDVADTFRNRKFREITLKSGTLLDRAFQEGANRPIGSFTTRGSTTKRLTSTEAAIKELALEGTSNIKPDRIVTLEVLESTKAKAGFINGGGKNAFQIFVDRSDLDKLRVVPGSIRVLE
jgi:RHS repeat-associated core domain